MSLLQVLQDDFFTNGVDTGKWSSFGTVSAGNPASTNLQLSSTLAGSYSAITSFIAYDLTGSYIFIQLVSAGNQAIPSWEVYPTYLTLDSNNKIYIRIALGQVQPVKVVAGVATNVGAGISYNSTTMKWFRIREASGTIYFDYAADPTTTWTNIASLANPFAVTTLTAEILCGTFAAESSSSTGIFDNFNVMPIVATKRMEKLQDDFEFGGVDSGTWGHYGSTISAGTTDSTDLRISSILAGNYAGLYSIYRYDLRGSYAFAQVLDVGNQSVSSWEVYPVYLEADSNNNVFFRISLGLVRPFMVVGGIETPVGSAVLYDSTTMKWFRIRESGGTLYYDYTVDPTGSWTNISSISNPIILTNMLGNILCGTFQAETSITTAIFDNFNVIPGEFQFAWSGYNWTKRIAQGPQSNNQIWGTDNISEPDINGYLTLNLTNDSGTSPVGCEIFSVQRGFGYGVYTVVVATQLDNIDRASCFGGMFTFDFTDYPAYREIDMNETREYYLLPPGRKSLLYNHTYPNGFDRVFITDQAYLTSDTVQTHRCTWGPNKIIFETFAGSGTDGPRINYFEQSTHLPIPGVERVHFNVFVDTGIPGFSTVAPLAVVIRRFSFDQTVPPEPVPDELVPGVKFAVYYGTIRLIDGSLVTYSASDIAALYNLDDEPYIAVPLIGPEPFNGGRDEMRYYKLKPQRDPSQYFDAPLKYNTAEEDYWEDDFDAHEGGKWAQRPQHIDENDY